MNNRKKWGNRSELTGLVVVLIATVWQLYFTQWFDEQSQEWRFLIQEDYYEGILLSQQHLADLIISDDQALRISQRDEISRIVNDHLDSTYKDDQRRREFYRTGQGNYFPAIGAFLLILASALLLVGRYLVITAEKEKK